MQPNATYAIDSTAIEPYKKSAFEAYLTFRALAGLMVDEVGHMKQMSLDDFCEIYDVNRTTVWRWNNKTPDLAMKIRDRRSEIVPLARESAALNKLLMIGMTSLGKNGHGDQKAAVQALVSYLGHHSDFKLPTQRQELEVKHSVGDLLSAAAADGIIEGEFTDVPDDHPRADGQDPGPLPPAS